MKYDRKNTDYGYNIFVINNLYLARMSIVLLFVCRLFAVNASNFQLKISRRDFCET